MGLTEMLDSLVDLDNLSNGYISHAFFGCPKWGEISGRWALIGFIYFSRARCAQV